jgi:hypothetical protein
MLRPYVQLKAASKPLRGLGSGVMQPVILLNGPLASSRHAGPLDDGGDLVGRLVCFGLG